MDAGGVLRPVRSHLGPDLQTDVRHGEFRQRMGRRQIGHVGSRQSEMLPAINRRRYGRRVGRRGDVGRPQLQPGLQQAVGRRQKQFPRFPCDVIGLAVYQLPIQIEIEFRCFLPRNAYLCLQFVPCRQRHGLRFVVHLRIHAHLSDHAVDQVAIVGIPIGSLTVQLPTEPVQSRQGAAAPGHRRHVVGKNLLHVVIGMVQVRAPIRIPVPDGHDVVVQSRRQPRPALQIRAVGEKVVAVAPEPVQQGVGYGNHRLEPGNRFGIKRPIADEPVIEQGGGVFVGSAGSVSPVGMMQIAQKGVQVQFPMADSLMAPVPRRFGSIIDRVQIQRFPFGHDQIGEPADKAVGRRMRAAGMLEHTDPLRVAYQLGVQQVAVLGSRLPEPGNSFRQQPGRLEPAVTIEVQIVPEIHSLAARLPHVHRRAGIVQQIPQVDRLLFRSQRRPILIRVIADVVGIVVLVIGIERVAVGEMRLVGIEEIDRNRQIVVEPVARSHHAGHHFGLCAGQGGRSHVLGRDPVRSNGDRGSFPLADAQKQHEHYGDHRQHDEGNHQNNPGSGATGERLPHSGAVPSRGPRRNCWNRRANLHGTMGRIFCARLSGTMRRNKCTSPGWRRR